MHHEAVAKAHEGPMSVHELHHQATAQNDMGGPAQVITANGLEMMRLHPGLAYPANSQSVSMFPSHPMTAVIPTPSMQGVSMDGQQMGRNHVVGALQLFEQVGRLP